MEVSDKENFEKSYKSRLFDVDDKDLGEQEFDLAPELCTGRFIRLNMIGKPFIQTEDNKYYVALQFFGVQGILFDQLYLS